jgi:phosphoenolpyruvate-protein kinase (PTS system EI component)
MMSKDNLQIIERKTIEQLVDELDFLNAQVFAKIKNDTDGGLIKNLNDLLNIMDKNKKEILESETSVSNNLQILQKILEKIEVSETTSEIRIISINNKFQKEIQNLKNEIIKEIQNNVKDINLSKLEKATNNSNKAIRKLIHFYRMTKIIHLKNNILTAILSFISGGALASLFLYFFN